MIQTVTCPICGKSLPPAAASQSRWFPFCGERCRNVDLYRWSIGRYAVTEPLADRPDLELEDEEPSEGG